MKVILISGKAQHGKDTSAGFLKKHLEADGKKVLIAHYADLLKFICKTYFGWDGQKDEAGRQLLQQVGTNIVRKRAPDYWVAYMSSFLAVLGDMWDYVLIPDTRFPNEVELMAKDGYDVIYARVDRPDFDNGLTEEQKKHPSETALDTMKPDIYIGNTGTLTYLDEYIGVLVKARLFE